MEARALAPTHELFVILESLQMYLPDFSLALAPLKRGQVGLAACDIYYREDTDVALLALRFDRRRFDDNGMQWVLKLSGDAGLAVLDPAMLPEADRARFYNSYLDEYPLRSRSNPTAADALSALTEILGLRVPAKRQLTSHVMVTSPPAVRTDDDATAEEPIVLEHLSEEVSVTDFRSTPRPVRDPNRSTRELGRGTLPMPGGRRDSELDVPRGGDLSPRLPTLPSADDEPYRPGSASLAAAAVSKEIDDGPTHPVDTPLDVVPLDEAMESRSQGLGVPPPLPPLARQRDGAIPQAIGKKAHRSDDGHGEEVPTRPGVPSRLGSDMGEKGGADSLLFGGKRRLGQPSSNRLPATRALSPRRLVHPRSTVRPPSRPPSPPAPERRRAPAGSVRKPRGTRPNTLQLAPTSPPPPTIAVRLRRGDEWVAARLRSLSLRGAYIACGAPPRLHDDVHIALSLGTTSIVARGTVVQVSDADGESGGDDSKSGERGTSGFGLVFPTADSPSRRQLKELLQSARSQGVVLEPPPPRTAARLPVRWPVRFILPDRRGLDLSALDVSRHGMFVATLERLPAGNLEFQLPTEDGSSISGRARVVREVPWKMAAARGLNSGFGLEITSVDDSPDNAFDDFVERVRRRARHKVLVGASAERADELAAGLIAAGYAVSGASDLQSLLQHTENDPRPPDAALIDASLQLSIDGNNQLCSALGRKKVPLVNIGGEAPQRARAVIDSLLEVD